MAFFENLIKNTFWLSVGQLISSFFSLFWVAILARYIGPGQYGIYGYGASLCTLVVLLVNFGYDQLIVLNASKQPSVAFPLLGKVLKIKLLSLPLYFMSLITIALINDWSFEWRLIVGLVSLMVYFDALAGSFVAVFHSRQLMQYDVWLQISRSAVVLLGTWVGIRSGLPFYGLIIVNALASLLRVIALWLMVNRILAYLKAPITVISKDQRLGAVLRDSLPLFLLSVASILYFNIVVIILERMNRSPEDLGVFVAATRLQSYIMLVPAILTTVLLPAFSQLYQTSKEEFLRKFQNVVNVLYWLSIVLALLVSINSADIVNLVYGSKFAAAAPLLSIQSLTLTCGSSYAFGSTMLVIGKRYLSTIMYAIVVLLVVLFAYLCIPYWGVRGACWAQVFGGLVAHAVYGVYLYRHLSIRFPTLFLLKILVIAGMTSLVNYFLVSRGLYFMIASVFSLFCFAGLSIALRLLSAHEWNAVKRIIVSTMGGRRAQSPS